MVDVLFCTSTYRTHQLYVLDSNFEAFFLQIINGIDTFT